MLRGENIAIGYTGSPPLIRDVNFTAREGQLIALLGINGIGKSTFLKTLAGIYAPLEGQIFLDEKEMRSLHPTERAKRVSAVFTARNFGENILVNDLIALGRFPYTNWLGKLTDEDNAIVEQVVKSLQIEDLRYKGFNRISDGEKQKVLIARALCQQTPVLILDEPTAFLDFRNREEIIELLRQIAVTMHKIILFSTHDLDAAFASSHRFWIINEQRTFSDTDNVSDVKELKRLLGAK